MKSEIKIYEVWDLIAYHCNKFMIVISDFDSYRKIRAAKKPKLGVPKDLPRLITQEFSPELAKPKGTL